MPIVHLSVYRARKQWALCGGYRLRVSARPASRDAAYHDGGPIVVFVNFIS